jgi:hypothetical protein
MHAVMGIWTMDPQQRERQNEDLQEKIVPTVKSAPGFVRGTWWREVAGERSASFIVFKDEPSARSFIDAVRGNSPQQSQAGVRNDQLVLVGLIAEATTGPSSPPPASAQATTAGLEAVPPHDASA